MRPDDYDHWLGVARRTSRRARDAEDLLHEALLAALASGRQDLSAPADAAWFAGVIRRQAAMAGRSAGRRARREALAARTEAVAAAIASDPDDASRLLASLRSLPRGPRSVAVLLLHGLSREEICVALGIAPTAFRQRLSSLRRAWERLCPDIGRLAAPSAPAEPEADVGLIRQALLRWVRPSQTLGTHDPDGHLIVIAKNPASRPHT